MEIIILIITNILAPVITGFATWLMAKKKYYSEVDSTVIANMKESLDFYKQLSDDNRERLKEVLDKNEQLEKIEFVNQNLKKRYGVNARILELI